MPRPQRTLSTLLGIVQDAGVRQALRSYTLDGPHGRLLAYDFDWDAYDDRAAGWLAGHDSSGDNSVAGWRREHGGLHTGATIKEALDARFEPLLQARRPYLARMLARHDLEAVEHALIDAQALPALGFWMIAAPHPYERVTTTPLT